MKEFLKTLFADKDGQQSTKRVIAMIGMLFLCGTMVATACLCSIKPDENLISSIEVIVIVALGATSLDKFAGGFSLGKKK